MAYPYSGSTLTMVNEISTKVQHDFAFKEDNVEEEVCVFYWIHTVQEFLLVYSYEKY